MQGIILVDKPENFTSFDVVASLKGPLSTSKIGHTGTLDPMATGVLPILVGKATKLCSLLPDSDKKYVAKFTLGRQTDTLDVTGAVINRCDKKVKKHEVEAVISAFIGDIKQIPPMYSAIKIDGVALHKIARSGKIIERPERDVKIYEISLNSFNEDTQCGEIEVFCSAGTYIRTLIDDIGQKLGTFAVMTALRRTMSHGFTIDQCKPLDNVRNFFADSMLHPVDEVLSAYPEVYVSPAQSKRFNSGGALDLSRTSLDKNFTGFIRVKDENGLVGLGNAVDGEIKIACLFDMQKKLQLTTVALGTFDGVHVGHQKLIETAVEKNYDGNTAVITFARSPKNAELICSPKKKTEIIKSLGVKEVVTLDFEEIKDLEPKEFFEKILLDKYGAKQIVCGFNYRFGKKASGDVETLKDLCSLHGVELFVCDEEKADGVTVSSSKIREFIKDGKMGEAKNLLGRFFEVDGKIARGKGLGTDLGFPTANVIPKEHFILPKSGVYATYSVIDGKTYPSVTNCGTQPTVDGDKIIFETFVFDFSGNIYGKRIMTGFLEMLRGIKKFDSLEALTNQISYDVNISKEIFKKRFTKKA